MPKPSFLGIGGQRCGTTFLNNLLARCPDVTLPSQGLDPSGSKELHFFDKTVLEQDFAAYEATFAGPGPVFGEITPSYSILAPGVVARIARYLGAETRLLFLVRDPVDRVISHYCFSHGAVGPAARSDLAIDLPDMVAFSQNPDTVLRTRFRRTIGIWAQAFGEANIMVVPFGRLVGDPAGNLPRIARFIGAAPETALAESAGSPNPKAPSLAVAPEVRRYLAWKFAAERGFVARFERADGVSPIPVTDREAAEFAELEAGHAGRYDRQWQGYRRWMKALAERLDVLLAEGGGHG